MSSILIIVDMEEGHLFPVFGLAHSLVSRGHEITFVSVADNEEYIRDQGFNFKPVLTDKFPKGSRHGGKIIHQHNHGSSFEMIDMPFDEGSAAALLEENPDLIITTTFLSLEALLVFYKFGLKSIIFTPYLVATNSPATEAAYKLTRQPMETLISLFSNLGSIRDKLPLNKGMDIFAEPLTGFTEIIGCPRELEMPGDRKSVV